MSEKHTLFGMGMYKEYHDFSYVDIKHLTLALALYEEKEPDAQKVTIEDVKDFLSAEYDDNGDMRLLNQPDNISEYVDWYWHGGLYYLDNYWAALSMYAYNHQDKYQNIFLYNMDLDMLNELIEDFMNCPDKEKYGPY